MRTFLIQSNHEIWNTSYDEGQLDYVNGYNLDKTIRANNWQDAVNEYLEKELHYNLTVKDCEIYENRLETGILVDADNSEASDYEIEQWKNEELNLYDDMFYITVSEIIEVKLSK